MFDGALTVYATLGETVMVQLNVSDPNGDPFLLRLGGSIANVNATINSSMW